MSAAHDEEMFIGATYTGTKSVFCFHARKATTSLGIWFGDDPLDYTLPALICQVSIIFLSGRLTHAVLRHLGQPYQVSQIMAGIILGPSLLGRNLKFRHAMHSPQTYEQITTIAIFALMLFFFVVGVKADLGLIPKAGKKAVAIAVLSTMLPVGCGYLTAALLKSKMPSQFARSPLLFLVTDRWSVTSYAVLSDVLTELNLLSSKLGRLAMSATLIGNFVHLFANAGIVTYLIAVELDSPPKGVAVLVSFLGMMGLIVFVMRPLVLWLIRRTPEGALLDEQSLVAVLLMVLVCGILSQSIGFELSTGPFFFGLVLPGGPPLGATLVERTDKLIGLFLPLTMVGAGLKVQLAFLADAKHWGLFEIILLTGVATKFAGVVLPCLYCKMPPRDTLSLALMLISKGIFEVGAALEWQEDKVLDHQDYTVLVLTIMVFGATAPLIKYLYRPEDRYVAFKRRTLQHANPRDELRVLACIHHEHDVNSILNLLDACGPSRDSPICVYLLHLIQLVGRTDAVLRPHQRPWKSSSAALSESDHIVNAFRLFEQQYSGGVSLLPHICISPYNTMHDGVCSLALDKKVALVILSFHRNHGNISFSSPAVQAVNVNVLRFAPCSVGILIDNGLSAGGTLLRRVAVYFLGGADDREALACGARMADNSAVALTVVRFLLPKEWREEGRDDKIDDRMLKQFQNDKVDGKRVVYREEMVKDGEGTVAVIRETSPHFSLLIVGRREGKDSMLTAGMSVWREFPELGIIGDLLASTNFGVSVSTLVVQQQVRLIGGGTVQAPHNPRAASVGKQTAAPAATQD